MQPLTRRQALAIREYRRGYVTQQTLASEWGISQPAVSRRLSRAREKTGYTPPRKYRRVRLRAASLSDLVNV